jgi:hypothetical protein
MFSEGAFPVPIAPPAEASVRRVDPCTLVTYDDATRVFGQPASSTSESTSPQVWQCRWVARHDSQRNVSITVDESPHRDVRGFMRNAARNGHGAVEGVGEEAYAFNSPAGFTQLDIREGDGLLALLLNDASRTDRVDALVEVGRKAVERLRSGEGVHMEPGPLQAIVGRWTAGHEGEQLELDVSDDLALTLSARGSSGELTEGKGYVDLLEDGRARLHLPPGVGRTMGAKFDHDAIAQRFYENGFEMMLFDGSRIAWSRPGTVAAPDAPPKPSSASGTTTAAAPQSAPSGQSDLDRAKQTTSDAGRKAVDATGRAASEVGGFFKGLFGKRPKKDE